MPAPPSSSPPSQSSPRAHGSAQTPRGAPSAVSRQRWPARLPLPMVLFAVPTIVGELKRHFRDHCWMVRPPRRIQELRARAVAVREEVEQQLGREPSTEELAGELDVDPGELAESLASASSYRPLSLDAPLHGSSGDDAGSLLGEPGDLATQLAERITVRRVVAGLPPRDRQIIVWRFVEECTQHEIGRRLGQSQMQVSRHLARILQQVRHSLEPAAALAG